MKKFIQLALFIFAITFNIEANSINKPISSQYGFIENKGQIIDQNNNPNPNILYLYNGNGLRVQLRKEGFSYEVINTIKTPKTIIDKGPQGKFDKELDMFDITYQTHRVDINFKDGNKNSVLKPYQPASDFINYYTTGTSEAGVTNVHHYQKVVYENVYPNIDIEFVLNDTAYCGKFKYNFIVKPNGNLADIKLEFLGANRTSLNQDGNILIETNFGNIEENIPLSYVINNNNSHSTIKANFITLANNIFGVDAENYNHNQTLVIDPTPWATYYGGSGDDYGRGIKRDASGNIIITGVTQSSTQIATSGAHKTTNSGSDAFITKFNTNGIRILGTYYGGSSTDSGSGITTDSSGNIIITGRVFSDSAIATTGSHQAVYGGSGDAFIAKFNTNGVRQWATYYGGNGTDIGNGITTDSIGNIIITGQTGSTNGIATTGSHQTTKGGNDDAFIVKFNTNGVRQWATYYGGSNDDYGQGIAVNDSGGIIIIGYTFSTTVIATIGAYQTIFGGISDAFIVKFNTNGVRHWATYYGGSGGETGQGIIVNDSGNIIITGGTSSTTAIAMTGAYQTIFGGSGDAFIAKFNTNGVRQWATYYGGSGTDNGIATNTAGAIVIIGQTASSNAIATTGAYQTSYGGFYDAFVVKFNSNGGRVWGTFFGGSSSDDGNSIISDSIGTIYATGYTNSTSTIATTGVHQTTNGGSADAYIAKFNPNGTLPVKLISFNATLANEKVNCTWETASETNNDYFTIERSKDGENFESIGNIKGQGNSTINTRYSYTDNNPFSGISYYRLKQTDFDEKYTFSTIKKVGENVKLTTEFSLYYENNNPIVKIKSLAENSVTIELLNLNGVKLFTNEHTINSGENTLAINGNITTGLYLLKVQVENKVEFFKVWVR